VVVDVPSMHQHKVVSRAVESRTKDDFAVLQDLAERPAAIRPQLSADSDVRRALVLPGDVQRETGAIS